MEHQADVVVTESELQPIRTSSLPEIVGEDFKNCWKEVEHEDYHRDSSSCSSSAIKEAIQSQAKSKAYFDSPEEDEDDNDALRVGTLVHLAVLEPEKFKQKLIMMPDFGAMQSSKNRATRDFWLLERPKGTIVCKTEKEFEMLLGCVKGVLDNPEAVALLKGSKREIAGYYRDPVTGLYIRIKPDIINFEMLTLSDLKTCRDASPRAFKNQMREKNYHVSLHTYSEGFRQIEGKKIKFMNFIAVEKKPPYECWVYVIDDFYMEQAEKRYRLGVDRIAAGIKTGVWEKAGKGINLLQPDHWEIQQEEI